MLPDLLQTIASAYWLEIVSAMLWGSGAVYSAKVFWHVNGDNQLHSICACIDDQFHHNISLHCCSSLVVLTVAWIGMWIHLGLNFIGSYRSSENISFKSSKWEGTFVALPTG